MERRLGFELTNSNYILPTQPLGWVFGFIKAYFFIDFKPSICNNIKTYVCV